MPKIEDFAKNLKPSSANLKQRVLGKLDAFVNALRPMNVASVVA